MPKPGTLGLPNNHSPAHWTPIMTQDNTNTNASEIFEAEVISKSDESTEPLTSPDFRRLLADQTVRNWSQWATVAGFIPVPVLDVTAIGALQVKLVAELCKIYDVPFKEEAVKSVLAGLTGSAVTSVVSGTLAGSLTRFVPYVGTALASVSQPVVAYATTFAVGAVFIKHFESKGSLTELSADSVKGFYQEQYAKAKGLFKRKKNSDAPASDAPQDGAHQAA